MVNGEVGRITSTIHKEDLNLPSKHYIYYCLKNLPNKIHEKYKTDYTGRVIIERNKK